MKAKPTRYKGIQFRSRLEATWAAFFDQCRWQWEYEPNIFDGAGWLPDFLIRPGNLVEVKPVEDPQGWPDHPTLVYMKKRPLNQRPILLLGTNPFCDQICENGPEAFRIGSVLTSRSGCWAVEAAFLVVDKVSTSEEDGLRIEAIGIVEASKLLEDFEGLEYSLDFWLGNASRLAKIAWSGAKNSIQWNPTA